MKPLSIIIPTLNEKSYLPRLLESIVVESKNYTSPIQVVIVDGKSKDDTVEVARSFGEVLPNIEIYSHQRGISKQRNFGASKAKYETIIFCDADMIFTKNSLKAISTKIHNGANFIAMPLIYPYDGKLIDFILGTVSYAYFFAVQRLSPVISGMCIITTKSVHEKINGFDEDITHAEDIDYGIRAVKTGAKHRVFLNVHIKTSARRLDKDGRVKTGLTWLQWHQKARKDRSQLYMPNHDYEFGKFNK